MRYCLIRFKGEPTTQLPVGMNDIMGLSEYENRINAKRYLWDCLFWPARDGRPNGTALLRVLAENGYTHFGLYEVPRDFRSPDILVDTFKNPFSPTK